METTERDVGDVEEGDVVVLDGDRCLVSSTSTSSGGKHGTAKVALELTSLSDGSDRRINQPEDSAVDVLELESSRNPLIMIRGDGDHFDPAGVRVRAGSNVVWMWDDDDPHQLVADDVDLESDRDAGEGYTFERTFEDPGTYVVRCREHDAGCVIVAEDS